MKVIEKISKATLDVMSDPLQHVLATTNRPRSIEVPDDMSLFYHCYPDGGPIKQQYILSVPILYDPIIEHLISNNWECVRLHESYDINEDLKAVTYQTWIHSEHPAMIVIEGGVAGGSILGTLVVVCAGT
jgi:hypothetical protein